jgi:hypothetical protein
VLRAWRQLDLALRVAIGEPKEGTTIKSFMDTSNPTGLTLLGYLTVGMTYTTHSLTIEGNPHLDRSQDGDVLGISLALTYATTATHHLSSIILPPTLIVTHHASRTAPACPSSQYRSTYPPSSPNITSPPPASNNLGQTFQSLRP